MEKIVVDKNRINDYMHIMYNHLDEFKNVINEMEKEREAIEWEGTAATSCFNLYNKMISNYLLFATKMMEFVDYLNGYVEGYDVFIDEIRAEFKKLKNKYNLEEENEKN